MGAETSNLVPKPAGFDYMTVTFYLDNRIRMLYAEEKEVNIVREVIQQQWKKGIKEEISRFDGAHDFEMNGKPFNPGAPAEKFAATRRMTLDILFRLYNVGCKFLFSSDLVRVKSLATWFFHREQLEPLQHEFSCIGLSNTDKLQFINFPPDLTKSFENVVKESWPMDIQRQKEIDNDLQVKLWGNPWESFEEQKTKAKQMIRNLINHLSKNQWGLCGSSTWKGTCDTMFFKYDPHQPVDGSLATYFFILLTDIDKIRCIDAPEEVTTAIRNVICTSWGRGLKEEKLKHGSVNFKLAGSPWLRSGKGTIETRVFVCKMLEALMGVGWKLQLALDLSIRVVDKCSLAFQRCAPMTVSICCVCMSGKDKLRIINAPENLVTALQAEVTRTWQFGIDRVRNLNGTLELKLKRRPWTYRNKDHDGSHAQVMLCHIVKASAQLGWYIILSADVSARYVSQEDGPDYPLDVHSFWFVNYNSGAAPPTQFGMTAQPPPLAPPQFGLAEATAPPLVGQAAPPLAPTQFGMAADPPAAAPPQYGMDEQGGTQFGSVFTYGPST